MDGSLVLGSREADVGAFRPQFAIAGAGGIDAAAVHLQPLSHLLELADRGGMEAALAVGADPHHEIASLGHAIDQVPHHPSGALVVLRDPLDRKSTRLNS